MREAELSVGVGGRVSAHQWFHLEVTVLHWMVCGPIAGTLLLKEWGVEQECGVEGNGKQMGEEGLPLPVL